MRAVVCRETKLEVEEVADPVPGPGQVLLEVVRGGICGSDLHARKHADQLADLASGIGYHDVMRPHESVVMGHEFSGRVLDYGPSTRKPWTVGTPVVSLPMIRMGDQVQMTGLSAKAPGAYAERVLVQESLTMDVPNGLSPETAALTEPMAVAWHAVRRSGVRKKETAVVIGCGPIGLAVILMLKARGVRHVVASDFSAGRRALAERCGADVVIDPGAESPWTGFEDSRYITDANDLFDLALDTMGKLRRVPLLPWARVLRAAEAAGATPSGPVVFECVGVPGIIDQVINQAPLATRVVVVGVCMEPDTIQPAMAINKEIELRFVFAYQPHEFHETLRLIADGTVDPTPLITATVGLDGVAGAFEALGDPERHAKILVDPASSATV
ncbi:MAG: alcohol dehydrogenase [Marmoricola sp.]|jgi:threonine dehydrogenase-like Zn-dependent dehydrogenase|nr:alcohol dehydrogenase [Marmoricola sp.]